MRRSEVCVAALVMSMLGAPSSATAGEEDARSFFAKGRDLRADGKCDEAIVSFRKALETYPEGIGSLRNIAECEEQIGRYASARRSYWDLRRAAMQTSEPKYAGWERDAEAGYKRLESKVPHLTVTLVGDKLDRVKVVLDGAPLDPRLVGSELERDPGPHVIEAHWGGSSPVTEKFTLGEAQRHVVTLTIPAPPPVPVKKPGTDRPVDDGAGLRTAGFVALGLGAASAVGFGISLGMRQGALSAVEGACPNYETQKCDPSVDADRARGETASLMVNIFAGLTLAGLGTGVTLLIMGSRGGPDPKAGVTVTPSPNGAMSHATMRF